MIGSVGRNVLHSLVVALGVGTIQRLLYKTDLLSKYVTSYSLGQTISSNYPPKVKEHSNEYKAYSALYYSLVGVACKHILYKCAIDNLTQMCESNMAKYLADFGIGLVDKIPSILMPYVDNKTKVLTYRTQEDIKKDLVNRTLNSIAYTSLVHSTNSSNIPCVLASHAMYMFIDWRNRGTSVNSVSSIMSKENKLCLAKTLLCSATSACLAYSSIHDNRFACSLILNVVANTVFQFKLDEKFAEYIPG